MGRLNGFVARRAQQYLFKCGVACVMDEHGGWLTVGGPAIAPAHQGYEGGGQVEPFGGKSIFMAQGAFLIGHFVQDAMVDEPSEPVSQQVLGDAKVVADLAKPMHAAEDVAQYQQRPAITDQIESRLNRTLEVVVRCFE